MLERSQQRVLRSDGSELGLTPRLFAALRLFVENPDVLLDKDTLMRALWPGLVVEENNLSQTISALRRALGDEPPGSRFIQTVARRGFRFIAPVRVLDDAAAAGAPQPPQPPQPRQPPDRLPAPAAVPPPAIAPVRDPGPLPTDRRRWLQRAGAGTLAAGLAGVLAWVWSRERAAAPDPAATRATLAVLPFVPLSAESRDELLEIGMADSLIARLSVVPGLVVRSVGSARRYAGATQDPLRAAQELNVAWVVDGSLQRRGDELRVTARLLRAADGSAVWSGSFNETFTGVFDIQDLISARVMQTLGATVQASAGLAASVPQVNLGGTRNTAAYELYLAASRHFTRHRGDSLRKSIALYDEALKLDPGYALAHVGLAATQRERLLGADGNPAEVVAPARTAVTRALALAPDLAEALTEKAFGLYYFEFDWPGAEREFRRALAANPNVAFAHHGLGQLLLTQDRPDEGLSHMRLARELDPLSPFLNTIEASYLLARGRLDDAQIRLNRAFDVAPDFYLAHRTQGFLHWAQRRPDLTIASLRRAIADADGNSRPSALLGLYLARTGQAAETRLILDGLIQRAQTRYVPAFSLAVLHAALGEHAAALDALERAYVVRDPQLVFLKDDGRWSTALRQEPRFAALLSRLKLDRFGPGTAPS